ncbi:MAG: alpha/beta fold hydrolase, partial [Acutalibacteraceae bacterium]
MNATTHQCQASHGATLVYDVMGQGAPVVLLHGNSQNSSYFEQQFDVLSQSYQLIALVTRAHGRSSRGTAPLDFYLFA